MDSSRPLWLTLAPVVFLALWSAGYAVAKVGLQYSEPMTLLALRFGLVVIIMAIAFVIMRPPLPDKPMDWVHLAVVGFLIQSVYFGMCYIAFRAGVAAGTVALLMSLQPILVALLAPSWTGENIGWRRWAGLGLGLLGTAVVIAARSEVEPPTIFGFTCTALALIGITAGSLWEKRFGLDHHPVTANLVGYAAGLIGIVPAMLLLETMQVTWTWEFSIALSYLVIGNSVIAVGLLLAMIRAGDVSRVSALFFLVPPLAALLAWLLLGEIMPPVAWIGMIVAAFGVYLATQNVAQTGDQTDE
ncbi:MAG: EamA family transporter [Rhizobiaceae bacterium]|nr:EamA family transporter [Rhizobiaceae bacterium]